MNIITLDACPPPFADHAEDPETEFYQITLCYEDIYTLGLIRARQQTRKQIEAQAHQMLFGAAKDFAYTVVWGPPGNWDVE